jgi:hypothetical protein
MNFAEILREKTQTMVLEGSMLVHPFTGLPVD